jgi:hypothetical protein
MSINSPWTTSIMSLRIELAWGLAAAITLLSTGASAADSKRPTEPAEAAETSESGAAKDAGFHVRFGARFPILIRPDSGYFTDARVFAESPSVTTSTAHLSGDPIPPAVGIALEVGAEVIPRLSLMGSFRTMTNGVETGSDMRLSLNTQAWIGDARWAVLRTAAYQDDKSLLALGQIELVAGVGYYTLTEKFVDRALFDGTIAHVSSGIGGRFGIDATAYLVGVGFVVGYAYDVTNASVSDRLGGSVKAGGHEITMGLAFRL